MPGRQEAVRRLCATGVVAVVRADSSEQLIDVAGALLDGGVDCIEITMTTPNALEVIAACRQAVAEAFIGVGSVLDADTARAALEAGAQYVVSPVFCREVVAVANDADVPVMPGCLTPTEIHDATAAGADIIKVFPAGFFGAKYFKAVLAPMPHLKLAPTGGVNLDTAADFIAAGAATLGVGSALVTRKALAEGNLDEIRRLAGEYVRIVAEARAAKGA